MAITPRAFHALFTSIAVCVLLCASSIAHAANFTSVTNGCWNDPFTWDPLGASGTPTAGDDVTVATGTQVFLCSNQQVDNLTISSGGIFYHGGYLITLFGSYICEGTHNSGGTMRMRGGASDSLRILSSAAFSFTGSLAIFGTKTFTATSDVQYLFCDVSIQSGDTLINNGTLWNRGTIVGADGTSAFILGANAMLYVQGSVMATGHYDGTAAGSLTYFWAETKNVPVYGGTSVYGDVVARSNSSRRVILQEDVNVDGFFYRNTSITDVRTNGHTLSVAGDFRTFGAQFISGQGDIDLDGAGAQEIRNETAMSSIEFNNLTISGSNVTPAIDIDVLGDFAIAVGGSFDVTAADYTVSVEGNFDNDGTFVARDGTFAFTGTNAQVVTGNSTTTFKNLEVNKAAGTATITSGTFEIDSTLIITAGIIDPSGNLTLLSDASRTARIAPIVSGSISGSLVAQRFISARDAAWQDLASPVSTTLADWDQELFMSGLAGGNDGSAWDPIAQQVFKSVKKWDEAAGDYIDVNTVAETLEALEGFEIYLGSDTASLEAVTVDANGIPYQGDQALPLTFTASQGWHLVGNPYASWVEWDSIFDASANIDNNFYIANAATGNFSTYGAGDLIPPGQGFWVHCTAATTLNLSESHKTTTSSSTFFRQPSAVNDALVLHISSAQNHFSHQALVRFSSTGNNALTADDARYLASPLAGAPAITTAASNGTLLAVNELSGLQREVRVPVHVTAAEKGFHTLRISGTQHISNFNCAVLIDHQTGQHYEVSEGVEIQVFLTNEQNSARFELALAVDGSKLCNELNAAAEGHTTAQAQNNGIAVAMSFDAPQDVTLSVYNTLGQLVAQQVRINAVVSETTQLELPAANGIYTVVAQFNGHTESHKVLVQ